MKKLIFLLGLIGFALNVYAQYPNNEDGQYEDMLTPEYYNTPIGGAFRLELNKFVHFARQIPFQHPFEDPNGQIVNYTIKRSFGDGIGPGGSGSHHPANDYYVARSTQVDLYAAHDGLVNISRDVSRYRHHLSITTEVKDSFGINIGKLVTIYAHIDLDLDSISNLNMEGKYVKKGDLVSKHLYSGTKGGAHLHFEIRYYRTDDSGDEDFYGGNAGSNTSKSSGSWMYGFWNPNIGYGFAHPFNQIDTLLLNVVEENHTNKYVVFPNPTKDQITINLKDYSDNVHLELINQQGQILQYHPDARHSSMMIDLDHYPSGIYLVRIFDGVKYYIEKIIKE